EHFDNAALGATVFAMAFDAHHHAIAVERALQVVLRDKDVAVDPFNRPFGRDKPEAGWMAVELADDEVHAIGQAITLAGNFNELAVLDEAAQRALERD